MQTQCTDQHPPQHHTLSGEIHELHRQIITISWHCLLYEKTAVLYTYAWSAGSSTTKGKTTSHYTAVSLVYCLNNTTSTTYCMITLALSFSTQHENQKQYVQKSSHFLPSTHSDMGQGWGVISFNMPIKIQAIHYSHNQQDD